MTDTPPKNVEEALAEFLDRMWPLWRENLTHPRYHELRQSFIKGYLAGWAKAARTEDAKR